MGLVIAGIKQRDLLCYKTYTAKFDGEIERFVCIRERGHRGKCSGHTWIGDCVPKKTEIVHMQCEGFDVPVNVWFGGCGTGGEMDEDEKPGWYAYAPVPYDFLADGKSRESVIAYITKYLKNFEEKNPDLPGLWPRCMKCQEKLHGDFITVDATHYYDKDLLGIGIVRDPDDEIKRSGYVGILAGCIACLGEPKKSEGGEIIPLPRRG